MTDFMNIIFADIATNGILPKYSTAEHSFYCKRIYLQSMVDGEIGNLMELALKVAVMEHIHVPENVMTLRKAIMD